MKKIVTIQFLFYIFLINIFLSCKEDYNSMNYKPTDMNDRLPFKLYYAATTPCTAGDYSSMPTGIKNVSIECYSDGNLKSYKTFSQNEKKPTINNLYISNEILYNSNGYRTKQTNYNENGTIWLEILYNSNGYRTKQTNYYNNGNKNNETLYTSMGENCQRTDFLENGMESGKRYYIINDNKEFDTCTDTSQSNCGCP